MSKFAIWLKKIRAYLNANLVFFEVFEKLFLGIMAIVVGYYQTITAEEELRLHKQEFEINAQELKINKLTLDINKQTLLITNQEVQPKFLISYKYENSGLDIDSDDLDTKSIEIINEGHEVLSFNCDINVYYELMSIVKEPLSIKIFYIPIYGFYEGESWNNNLKKVMVNRVFFGNKRDFDRAEGIVDSYSRENHTVSIKDKALIRIGYKDILGIKHEEYYIDSMKVNSAAYKSIADSSKAFFKNRKFLTSHVDKELIKELIGNRK